MNLPVINQNGQRVLTTARLADCYGTDVKVISKNFTNNKNRYAEGKHYIYLTGDDLRAFREIYEMPSNINSIYLWTEKGAWLHAKSLNTDQAWDAYEMLVDEYYRLKDTETKQLQPKSQAEVIAMLAQYNVEQEKRLAAVEERVELTAKKQDTINEILSLNPTEWRKKVNKIITSIAMARGGFEAYSDVRNESYKFLEERARCILSKRLTNKRQKMALEGVPKSKIDKVNNMDVIADDARLTEIYLAVVKEMAIKHGVEAKVLSNAN